MTCVISPKPPPHPNDMTGGSLAQKEFTFSRSSRLAGAGQACTPPHDRENRAQMTWFWRFWPMVQDALPAGSPEAAPGVGFLYIFLFSGPGGCVMSFLPNPPPQMTDVISMNTKTISWRAPEMMLQHCILDASWAYFVGWAPKCSEIVFCIPPGPTWWAGAQNRQNCILDDSRANFVSWPPK